MTKKKVAKGNHPGGRPTRYQEKYIVEAMKLATLGVGEEQIAWFLGVHPVTFRRWKKKHGELCTAIKRGKADRNVRLHKAMYDSAITRGNIIMQIFLAKNWLGMSDRQDINFPPLADGEENILKIKVVHTNSKRTPASGEDPQAPARSSKPPRPPGEKPKLKVPAKEIKKQFPLSKKKKHKVKLST